AIPFVAVATLQSRGEPPQLFAAVPALRVSVLPGRPLVTRPLRQVLGNRLWRYAVVARLSLPAMPAMIAKPIPDASLLVLRPAFPAHPGDAGSPPRRDAAFEPQLPVELPARAGL